ncbi:uncharacterized protein KY384_005102 [Bacidia gigantensis]|uniref:uncharacterized protein n=1 Tax=Bacidia gigantensis TaxID=2732470 RepID=UPI001D03A118|nr:uncharacterized protein KY384_005102 [Bacidia gigantensis]KAG8529622.1 hypothetical protein KY384_005102 [Bacidia gigantensis]
MTEDERNDLRRQAPRDYVTHAIFQKAESLSKSVAESLGMLECYILYVDFDSNMLTQAMKDKGLSEVSGTEYVTLSHRWGHANIFRLTNDNLPQLKNGFEISALPKTFVNVIDAIRKHLPVRYLWIDSLCKIQDEEDLSDWIREAAQMEKVYENAFCNISATGAEDSSQGLYHHHRPDLLTHFCVDLCFGWLDSSSDSTVTYAKHIPMVFHQYFKNRQKSDSSAWTQQPKDDAYGNLGQARFFAHQLWPRIVEIYSNCQLTMEKDKLVAISGIAKRMRVILQDEYVPIFNCLVDLRDIELPAFPGPLFDGVINVGTPEDRGILFSVEDVSIQYASADTTGLVSGGHIVLKGSLKALRLRRNDVLKKTWIVMVDGKDMVPEGKDPQDRLGPLVHLDVDQPDFEVENETTSLYCMLARAPYGDHWTFLKCLLLEHLRDGDYRRIGVSMTDKRELIDAIA